ncbi:MAG: tetratricopeptide repeat protein [Pyrinomonadaceae bacterium]
MIRLDNISLSITVCGVLLLLVCCSPGVNAQTPAPVTDAEAAQWREDLRYLAQEMPKTHKNLFHSMTREQFETAVNQLNEKIPSLARHQIIVGLMRIVAMAGDGDGHTSLDPQFNPKVRFRIYPLTLCLFADGLFIKAADKKYAEFVGARVLKIGNTPAEQAYKKVSEVVAHDNEMTFKQRVPFFLTIPEVLQSLGLISDMENASFVVEKNGKEMTILLTPSGPVPQRGHDGMVREDPSRSWVQMNGESTATVPLWLKKPDKKYWFQYLEDSRTMYVQYSSVTNQPDESIAAFTARVFEFVNSHEIDRFILDLRLNEGGNSAYNMPLLLEIIKSPKINQRGRLFTVIGRGTFSAAQNLVTELERYTNTIFVGEPTGARVHFYGDHEIIGLPNSGVFVAVASRWWQTMNPTDNRPWIAPNVVTPLRSVDYLNNIDPALNAILNYRSNFALLEPGLAAGDLPQVLKQYRDFKASPKTSPINTANEINTLGYRLIGAGKLDQAVEIFKLNVESYPDSANGYDSLGDAYLAMGNKELAIKSFRRALELNPGFDFTAQKLRQLTGGK